MKTFRFRVDATLRAVKTLKVRALEAGVPFQQYLGFVLMAAAEAEALDVSDDAEAHAA